MNQRIQESKSCALPLGYTRVLCRGRGSNPRPRAFNSNIPSRCKALPTELPRLINGPLRPGSPRDGRRCELRRSAITVRRFSRLKGDASGAGRNQTVSVSPDAGTRPLHLSVLPPHITGRAVRGPHPTFTCWHRRSAARPRRFSLIQEGTTQASPPPALAQEAGISTPADTPDYRPQGITPLESIYRKCRPRGL